MLEQGSGAAVDKGLTRSDAAQLDLPTRPSSRLLTGHREVDCAAVAPRLRFFRKGRLTRRVSLLGRELRMRLPGIRCNPPGIT